MEIALKKKHFIVLPLIAIVCITLSACEFTRKISEIIEEKSFKNKAEAQFKEDFPAYEVRSVIIRNINQRERAAMIFYQKPGVKGAFTAEWKYYDRDGNPDDSNEDWQLVEKGEERQVGIRTRKD